MKEPSWIAAALSVLALAGGGVSAEEPRDESSGKKFLVAVGDSLTFGFQEEKFLANPDPSNFDTGFVDVFARLLRRTQSGRHTRVENFGCPGETSASLLAGPCAYEAAGNQLHVSYAGAQIDAAVGFLEKHRERVETILIDIGSNDVNALVDSCGGLNLACVAAGLPGVIATLAANYAIILGRLRQAAPHAEIIVIELYNPYVVIDPATNALVPPINDAISAVAAKFHARIANPFPAIDLAQPQPEVGCKLTLMCTPLVDIHLSDAGYALVGHLAFEVSREDHDHEHDHDDDHHDGDHEDDGGSCNPED